MVGGDCVCVLYKCWHSNMKKLIVWVRMCVFVCDMYLHLRWSIAHTHYPSLYLPQDSSCVRTCVCVLLVVSVCYT